MAVLRKGHGDANCKGLVGGKAVRLADDGVGGQWQGCRVIAPVYDGVLEGRAVVGEAELADRHRAVIALGNVQVSTNRN